MTQWNQHFNEDIKVYVFRNGALEQNVIATGHQIHAYQWTEIPINDYVIDNAEELSEEGGSTCDDQCIPNF